MHYFWHSISIYLQTKFCTFFKNQNQPQSCIVLQFLPPKIMCVLAFVSDKLRKLGVDGYLYHNINITNPWCPKSDIASIKGQICRLSTSHSVQQGCPTLKIPSNVAKECRLHFPNLKVAPEGYFAPQHVPRCIAAWLFSDRRME